MQILLNGNEMTSEKMSAENRVAMGWILMFLVFICIFLTEFVASVLGDDLSIFKSREGEMALRAMVVLMMLHAFVPMLICVVDSAWFRWLIVLVTGLLTVALMGHQIGHLVTATKPFSIFHLLDFSHHGLGIWTTVLAVQWARQSKSM
jgi:hypothetical protein